MTLEVYKSALVWLDRGFDLIPCYPNSKMQLKGFGLYLTHITTADEAAKWWRDDPRKLNLAVVAPEGKFFILDFDDFDLYLMWLKQIKDPKIIASYSETTPGEGKHIFFSGADPQFRLDEKTGKMKTIIISGKKTFREERIMLAETKRIVLVAPSMISGKKDGYEVINDGEIYSGENVLFPLSALLPPPAPAQKTRAQWPTGGSKLDQIKAQLDIVQLVKTCFPKIKLRGSRRYRSARCPFHSEKHASFWVDTELNLYGCHGCATHGDAINLYAISKNISNSEAIKELMGCL